MNIEVSDPLSGLLFGQDDGRSLVNLKMLRGDGNVTDEVLRAEAHSALTQVRLGQSDKFAAFPEDNAKHRVNVNELVSKL